jgi:hypothetical protein
MGLPGLESQPKQIASPDFRYRADGLVTMGTMSSTTPLTNAEIVTTPSRRPRRRACCHVAGDQKLRSYFERREIFSWSPGLLQKD